MPSTNAKESKYRNDLINAFSRWIDLDNIERQGVKEYAPRIPWMQGYNMYPWLNRGIPKEVLNAQLNRKDEPLKEYGDTYMNKPESAVIFQTFTKLQYVPFLS